MDVGSAGALIVAVVGVVGTLLSALLTQRAADRSLQREQERADRAQARAREAEELRACYVALNASSRQYLAALTDQLHALLRADEAPEVRQRLTEARDLHRDVYAEAQMRLPDPVLAPTGAAAHALGTLFGRLRRLDDGAPRPGDSLSAVQEEIDTLWEQLRELRRGMRADLGVSRRCRPGPAEPTSPTRRASSGH
ncbi:MULTISPECIES: hypothetical protein [unclassified Streptomyces]|uniref:hypothetical protein n=1 Tax=unclassified Streptomyces TaxID=2593676 RepID=UPI000DAE405F|nr:MULTISPECIES: hypothetical protein [unclassified Streptomyces]PZT73678.1 hypothetical protein DNK55_15645 [Streptomyces sp. AC1-42T]PZT83329.1 hypothetical protein DNK56_15780 [Streptomyces sp. AC1-42W]